MAESNGREPRLLPIVVLRGSEYLIDFEHRQFRNFKNPDRVVNMHSGEGRQMVKESVGKQWRSYALDNGGNGRENWIKCSACEHETVTVRV